MESARVEPHLAQLTGRRTFGVGGWDAVRDVRCKSHSKLNPANNSVNNRITCLGAFYTTPTQHTGEGGEANI